MIRDFFYVLIGFLSVTLVSCLLWHFTQSAEESEPEGDSAALREIIKNASPEIAPKEPRPKTPPAQPILEARSDFSAFAETAQAKIPRISVLQNSRRDFHFPPPELLQSAAEMARIWETLKQDAGLAHQGMDFYRSCSANEDFPTAARAVCLRRMKDLATRRGLTPVSEGSLPELVRRVADELPKDIH